MAPKAATSNLTPAEMKLFAAIFQFTTTDPVCDWDKVAEAANYSNAANAKTMYRRFKKAIVDRNGAAGDTPLTTPTGTTKSAKSAKVTPKKNKRSATTESDEELDTTPVPKSARLGRKTAKAQAYKEAPSDDEDMGGDESEMEPPVIAKKNDNGSAKLASTVTGKVASEEAIEQQVKDASDQDTAVEVGSDVETQ